MNKPQLISRDTLTLSLRLHEHSYKVNFIVVVYAYLGLILYLDLDFGCSNKNVPNFNYLQNDSRHLTNLTIQTQFQFFGI